MHTSIDATVSKFYLPVLSLFHRNLDLYLPYVCHRSCEVNQVIGISLTNELLIRNATLSTFYSKANLLHLYRMQCNLFIY